MQYFDSIKIFNKDSATSFAADLFCRELNSRIDSIAAFSSEENADIVFLTNSGLYNDEYRIELNEDQIFFVSKGIRGAIYAAGMFLRKAVKRNNGIELTEDISGYYSPSKKIRGHQLGYRTTPNTYDAWSYEDYRRYYIDLMFFGLYTVEHISHEGGLKDRNPLMKYDEEDFLINAVDIADSLDIDISLWHPNSAAENDESAAKVRKSLYSKLSRLNYVFVPGGDPGSLPAKDFIRRCQAISKALKEVHPDAELWPSAQAPHEYPGWGSEFVSAIDDPAEEIDGIIYGPNHAMSLDEMRDELGGRFRFRFYPDITHNVRCEYPVHYDRNDWHYALCTCLGRECTNPRPREFYKLYKETEEYFYGSVSYSEGITDDVNKFLWSALDYNNGISADEAVSDYVRLFFFGADTYSLKNLIFGLEKNWEGNPEENTGIESVYSSFCRVKKKYPEVCGNWRFLQLYFRACCDKLIRDRLIFEKGLIEKSRSDLIRGNVGSALKILNTGFGSDYNALRNEIDVTADKLFKLIGYQSDVEHYFADNPERGAVLDTIDLPVTDRMWLLSKYREGITPGEWLEYFARDIIFRYLLTVLMISRRGSPTLIFRVINPVLMTGVCPPLSSMCLIIILIHIKSKVFQIKKPTC